MADISAENLQVRKAVYLKWSKKKPITKNTLLSMSLVQSWCKDYNLYRQAKAKTVQHHQTSFTMNVRGVSLSGKEKATARNMKITQGKNLIIKGKYLLKVVSQPSIKLVS